MTESAWLYDVWKAKVEFQSAVYKVADGRLTSFNGEVGVIITAAVAVLGFGVGAASSRKVVPWLLIGGAAAAAATALLALYARRDSPWLPGLRKDQAKEAARRAGTAVGALHAHFPGESFPPTEEAYRVIFTAWHAMVTSADARLRLKRAVYNLAVLGLFVELAFVLVLLATAEPS